MNVVGQQIRRIRVQQEMTQAKLAERCQLIGWDISREGLAKIESGFRGVSDVEVLHIAKALKTHLLALFPSKFQ